MLALTHTFKKTFSFFLLLSALCFLIPTANAQEESSYFLNYVTTSDGEYNEQTPPLASFTAYLNNDRSRIITENSPRLDHSDDPNINTNGSFGVDVGLFQNPALQAGDNIYVSFSHTEYMERGILKDSVKFMPLFRPPKTLQLSEQDFPNPPQNIAISMNDDGTRTITWNGADNTTYTIYRRSAYDTLSDGSERKVYYRIAENIDGNSFTDSNNDTAEHFIYLLYAVDNEGVFSPHSDEIDERIRPLEGLNADVGSKNVTLSWNPANSDDEVAGYTIYRREEGELYGAPVAYSGTDTFYTDTRLLTNHSYYYKVTARKVFGEEVAVSPEKEVTTNSFDSDNMYYANLKMAIVIYQKTNRGIVSNQEVQEIKKTVDLARKFYWINSGLQLNIEVEYFPIKEMKVFPDPGDSWGSMMMTARDLDTLGVVNTQYDLIFRICPAISGYWSYGVQQLELPGPARKTGFSQIEWPLGTGVLYPGNSSGYIYPVIWLFVHEVQHAIDALYADNEHSEMYHGDNPQAFPVACGEQFDFQAKMFRTFEAYKELKPEWGDLYETKDLDRDRVPDNDPRVVLDETRFLSSPNKADTDADGLSDFLEAYDGTFFAADPNNADSDGDGIPDGEDIYPRYPVHPYIERFTPVIDGSIEDGWQMINDTVLYTTDKAGFSPVVYMNYDYENLYMAFYLHGPSDVEISFDFANDGWWWSAGNTMIKIDHNSQNIEYVRSLDASPEAREYSESIGGWIGGMWDNETAYTQHFGRKVVNKNDIRFAMQSEDNKYYIELAIPKNEYADLLLQDKDKIALNILYTDLYGKSGNRAETFDTYSFTTFTFGSPTDIDDNATTQLPEEFLLQQNYPNPFNPVTTITYAIPQESHVKLVVYDLLGREVATLINNQQNAGNHTIQWNGTNNSGNNVSSGIYIYKLETDSFNDAKKMILLR